MGDTYESLSAMLGSASWASGKNDEGENVLVNRGDGYICTETMQANGWTRMNYYHSDGTVEETFSR